MIFQHLVGIGVACADGFRVLRCLQDSADVCRTRCKFVRPARGFLTPAVPALSFKEKQSVGNAHEGHTHLVHWREGSGAVQPQAVHHLGERRIGVTERLQGRLYCALQQLPEGWVRTNVCAQRHGIDEAARQLLHLRLLPAGDWGADHNVLLAAVAAQERLQSGN